jgi:hypothetical protein
MTSMRPSSRLRGKVKWMTLLIALICSEQPRRVGLVSAAARSKLVFTCSKKLMGAVMSGLRCEVSVRQS